MSLREVRGQRHRGAGLWEEAGQGGQDRGRGAGQLGGVAVAGLSHEIQGQSSSPPHLTLISRKGSSSITAPGNTSVARLSCLTSGW